MLKLLLLTASLATLLSSSLTAVSFTVTPQWSAICPMPCHTLDEYASNISLFQGQENISIILMSGVHHLNHNLIISGAVEVTIEGLNNIQDTEIVVHNEARIAVRSIHDFKMIGVHILKKQHTMVLVGGQNQTVQLLNTVNIFCKNVSFESVDVLIKANKNQEDSIIMESCNFNKSRLFITSDSEQQKKQIRIARTTFSGNYQPKNFTKNSIHTLITLCNSTYCPISLTLQCPDHDTYNSTRLTFHISESSFSDWYSGISIRCRSYEVNRLNIEDSSFTGVANGVDISSSRLSEVAVINSEFTDFQLIGMGTAPSSLENFYTNMTQDYSIVSNLTVIGSNFTGLGAKKKSICISLSFWRVDYVSIRLSQMSNSERGINTQHSSRNHQNKQSNTRQRHIQVEKTNITKSDLAIYFDSVSFQSIVVAGCALSQNIVGILVTRSNVTTFIVRETCIEDNYDYGIYTFNSTFKTAEITSCAIDRNPHKGILIFEAVVENMYIQNSTLNKNGDGMVYEALPKSFKSDAGKSITITVYNTTVSENTKTGIIFSDLSTAPFRVQTNISFQNSLFASNGRNAISVQKFGPMFQIEDCSFRENKKTAVIAYLSDTELTGNVEFSNNTGVRGGALALMHSQVKFTEGSHILFKENSAAEYGGAIYVVTLKYLGLVTFREFFIDAEETGYKIIRKFPCFYLFDSPTLSAVNITVVLSGNKATLGGDNIYGASLFDFCNLNTLSQNSSSQEFDTETIRRIFKFEDNKTAISSNPTRVCFCFSNTTECDETRLVHNEVRYPGEEFTVPLILVGFEFGTLTGIIHATIITDLYHPLSENQQSHTAHKDKCNWLKYSVHSIPKTYQIIRLTTQANPTGGTDLAQININNDSIHNEFCIGSFQCTARLTTPIYINVTLEECPLGFKLNNISLVCECDETLQELSARVELSCEISDHAGLINREGGMWAGVEASPNTSHNNYLWNEYCPQDYCQFNRVAVDLVRPNTQCRAKRSGVLCGSCTTGYSLPLGSDRCTKCTDNAQISLILFLLVAGLLLVMLIKFLDLTVANGTVNGIIFYANVVWGYNKVLLPPPDNTDPLHWILAVPIAWINLDFGIETCFFVGLTSYSKAWLQFLFPIYIWSIAGLIILMSHYSRRVTKLFGNNSVAVLATLFLLSYGKILRNVIVILNAIDMKYSNSTVTKKVWARDGNLEYGKQQHGFLLALGLLVLVLIWLPYTLVLLLVPILKSKSHHKPFRWINTLKPFFDTYYGPYNDKLVHQCWTGILMVARGVLLVVFAAASNPSDNILFLGIISSILLAIGTFSMYKELYLSVSEIIYLLNLAILSGLWFNSNSSSYTATEHYPVYIAVSISFALIQITCLIIIQLVRKFLWPRVCARKNEAKNESSIELRTFEPLIITESDITFEDSSRYRDSILEYINYSD